MQFWLLSFCQNRVFHAAFLLVVAVCVGHLSSEVSRFARRMMSKHTKRSRLVILFGDICT